MRALGDWRFSCDRNATAAAYLCAGEGYTQSCTCNGCRNFVAAKGEVFPPQFLALLESLVIDPEKDGEVYHTCRMSQGKHLYGGWYHFIGTLEQTGDFPPVKYAEDFEVALCKACAPCLEVFKELPLVQLEFVAASVPWRLVEPEAE